MHRRHFLQTVVLGSAALGAQPGLTEKIMSTTPDNNKPMPVLFVGHGSPMNAIETNRWSRGFSDLAGQIPRPRAILSISAHWYVDGTWLTGEEQPRTIHDFGGFPRELYEIQYPAPGQPDLAKQVSGWLERWEARPDLGWGLDHGTWSVLRWMYPDARVPVLQLSIDHRLKAEEHLALARSLRDLRHQGVLVLGSGNIVHNLRDAIGRMRDTAPATPEWAARFDTTVRQATLDRDTDKLVRLWHEDDDGRLAHPTPDHWLPFIYTLGLVDADDEVRFPIEGFDLGSISMRSILWSPA